jgi:DnaJ-class molecular chaperone
MDDYEMLGLNRRDFAGGRSSAAAKKTRKKELAAAFRAQAMVWHPDHHQDKGEAWQKQCGARFDRIVQAHLALRNRL